MTFRAALLVAIALSCGAMVWLSWSRRIESTSLQPQPVRAQETTRHSDSDWNDRGSHGDDPALQLLEADPSRIRPIETTTLASKSALTAADASVVWEQESNGLSRADLFARAEEVLR